MTMPPNQPPQGAPINYESVLLTPQDVEHLKVLSICWWVLAGLQCLGICVGGAYLVGGILFLAKVLHDRDAETLVALTLQPQHVQEHEKDRDQ